ncbi:hypothetical protein SteCoe_14922 [Stentor coeruleus]|uniref:Peptidase C1A papain C-terminal domain-containing protein n=1 Tax=Stentor coeruleus TaxID=5963 RepID=A0A1R2C4Z4_9CILI|nr:hypothetical protein SteCoe_14922 [Stentor coeruleus]
MEINRDKSFGSKKLLLALILVVAGVLAIVLLGKKTSPLLGELELLEKDFNKYIEVYQKSYEQKDYFKRFQAFIDNSAYIRRHNEKNSSWKMSLNEFADMSPSEFASQYLVFTSPPTQSLKLKLSNQVSIPSSIDWRVKGAVTSVKNQGICGSCYAFSSTAAIEGIIAIKTGRLVELSIQQIVDCSKAYGNQGCNGGWMNYAFEYAMKHEISALNTYKYTGAKQSCQYDKLLGGVKISGYEDVVPYNVKELAAAVSNQPVSISVDATVWQFYSSGVIDNNCGVSLNHAVVAVGYSMSEKGDYWILKNSWGPYWGEQGFLKVAMADGPGLCGINKISSYPIL